MKSVILSVVFLLTSALTTFSQFTDEEIKSLDTKTLFNEGESYLSVENIPQALKYFLRLVELEPENAHFNYKAGYCYLFSANDKAKAIPFLRSATSNISPKANLFSMKEQRAPVGALYHLARAYHIAYELDSAVVYYKKFEPFAGYEEEVDEIERQIAMCATAKELMKQPVKLKIHNLGANINTPYTEHSPVISADETVLIFTSRNPTSTGDSLNIGADGKYYEDIYISYKVDPNCKVGCKWTKPVGIGNAINTENHEATIGLSADGQRLFIYKDDDGNGQIYESDKIGDTWSPPAPLGPTINSPEYEYHASLSSDENVLFFTRESHSQGYGGEDIYMSRRLPNGVWGEPQNLGDKINTMFHESSPFIHPDGVTLFFSSNGHGSMGGYDIFTTQFNPDSNSWSTPVNMGYPINTTDDDVSYVLSPDGQRAYYASSAVTAEASGDMDLYMIEIFSKETHVQAVTVMKGRIDVKDGSELPEDAQIVVTDNESQELIGIYKPNRKTGSYLLILKPGKNYNIRFEANNYMYYTDNLFVPKGSMYLEIQNHITLNPIEIDEISILDNIFFDTGSDQLKPQSKTELEKLYSLLMNNPKLVVGIIGHTDSQGNDQANMELSTKRAQAVVNFLIDKGISKTRMHADGKGETEPIKPNLNPDGTPNKENMAKNRRIELKILDTEGREMDIIKDID